MKRITGASMNAQSGRQAVPLVLAHASRRTLAAGEPHVPTHAQREVSSLVTGHAKTRHGKGDREEEWKKQTR